VPAAGLDIEVALWNQGYHRVVGVDEAGRGPLAGPVVVAGVILNPNTADSLDVDDSKKLCESRREALFEAIISGSIGHQIEVLGNIEIDELNILNATLKGMQQAVEALKPDPDYVLIDGNRLPKLTLPAQAVVKGDQKSKSIAAASILAKVTRDKIMQGYDQEFPKWEFSKHKGYPTKRHKELLQQYGPTRIHRKTFRW
jgi:ribonuclease HII